jgi:protein-tyrosine-phosphatase
MTPLTPKSVLFVCNMNSVRSPMAAAIMAARAKSGVRVDSAGVYEGGPDPFVEGVLGEIGISLGGHEPKAIDDAGLDGFDLIVALTPEAAAEIRRRLPRERVEFWPIENPSDTLGGRDALMNAYRTVRDELAGRIRARFAAIVEKP